MAQRSTPPTRVGLNLEREGKETTPLPHLPEKSEFPEIVYQIVEAIPAGRVMTYGGIAALIPPPRGMDWEAYERIRARWVGYALARCPDHLPWHRVVNGQGRISARPGDGPARQRAMLESEGVPFDEEGRINVEDLGWEPDLVWLRSRGLLRIQAGNR